MALFNDKQAAFIRILLRTRKKTRAEVVKMVRNIKDITIEEAKAEVCFIKYRMNEYFPEE